MGDNFSAAERTIHGSYRWSGRTIYACMATKFAIDGPAGPVVARDHLRRDRAHSKKSSRIPPAQLSPLRQVGHKIQMCTADFSPQSSLAPAKCASITHIPPLTESPHLHAQSHSKTAISSATLKHSKFTEQAALYFNAPN